LVARLLAICVLIFTLLQRREQYNALARKRRSPLYPRSVIHPTVEPSQEDLALPSTLQAYVESPIYARTTGYVKKWYHDIGSHVQKGDLLAEIEARKSISSFLRRVPTSAPCKPMKIFLASPPHVLKN